MARPSLHSDDLDVMTLAGTTDHDLQHAPQSALHQQGLPSPVHQQQHHQQQPQQQPQRRTSLQLPQASVAQQMQQPQRCASEPAGNTSLDSSSNSSRSNSSKRRGFFLKRSNAQANLIKSRWRWLTSPHVCWRHPLARIFVVWLIFVLDMLLYGEDPVNDSHIEANLPGLGHIWNFGLIWPSQAGLLLLRLFLVSVALLLGSYVGYQWVHHRLLRDFIHMEMFNKSNGTWLIMALCCALTFFLGLLLYNLFVDKDEVVSSAMGMEMREFAKLTQCCSVIADLIAIIMVTDAVMQDRTFWPNWAPRLKNVWSQAAGGWVRVIVVWVVFVGGIALAIWGVLQSGRDPGEFEWDDRRIGGLTEGARTFLMSGIVFCDLFTVVQDWGFPSFQQPTDVPLDQHVLIAGTFVSQLQCDLLQRLVQRCGALLQRCPRCLPNGCSQRCKDLVPDPSFFHITIDGAWLTYGPLLFVLCIDLFCTRTQLMYDPLNYGQYVEPVAERIWTIVDGETLLRAYDHGTLRKGLESLISYQARRNRTTGAPLSAAAASDVQLNSRYFGNSIKWLAATPGLIMLFGFFPLVWAANKRRVLLQVMDKVGNLSRSIVGSSKVHPVDNADDEPSGKGTDGTFPKDSNHIEHNDLGNTNGSPAPSPPGDC